MSLSPLDLALHYAAHRIPVLPLHHIGHDGQCSCGGPPKNRKCKPGKHPFGALVPKGVNDTTTDEATIKQWFANGQKHNLGIATGHPAGFWALDRDDRDGGAKTLSAWEAEHGPLPPTVTQKTGNGRHYLFKMPQGRDMRNLQNKDEFPGIDVRGTGGYICAAPSIHHNGNAYTWEGQSLPDFSKIADAPDWLLEKLAPLPAIRPWHTTPPPLSETNIPGDATGYCPPDKVGDGEGRESTLLKYAGSLRAKGLSQGEIERILLDYNRCHIGPPLDDDAVLDRARRYEAPVAMGDWPEPRPIDPALPDVLPFDLSLLPENYQAMVRDEAELKCTSPEMIAIPLMVATAAALGNIIAIAPKAMDTTWMVAPVLWGALVARTGAMKTPSISAGTKPLEALERALDAAYDTAIQKFKKDKFQYEADLQQAKSHAKAGKPYSMPTEPLEPQRERLIVNDTTFQKLGEILTHSPRGLLILRDEIVGLLESLGAEGQEGARTFYLEGWNGLGSYRMDRIGRGSLVIPRHSLYVLGGIQPEKLLSYVRQATSGGRDDDGLLQRFQLIVWPDTLQQWTNVDRMPNLAARQAVDAVFHHLRGLDPITLGTTHPISGTAPHHLHFTTEAQQLFDAWRAHLETSLRGAGKHPALESHLAKYKSLIPALALLIHLADYGTGPVPKTSLVKAIGWGRYLWSHAKRVYAGAINPSQASAAELAKRIKAGKLVHEFSAREVQRKGWTALANREQVAEAIDWLIDSGWLQRKPVTSGGRPTETYTVNPRVTVSSVS